MTHKDNSPRDYDPDPPPTEINLGPSGRLIYDKDGRRIISEVHDLRTRLTAAEAENTQLRRSWADDLDASSQRWHAAEARADEQYRLIQELVSEVYGYDCEEWDTRRLVEALRARIADPGGALAGQYLAALEALKDEVAKGPCPYCEAPFAPGEHAISCPLAVFLDAVGDARRALRGDSTRAATAPNQKG
jgi:hypothetical protein